MRAELAFHHAAVRGKPLQRCADDGDAESQPRRGLGGGEGPVRAGVARDKVTERVRDRFDEGQRHTHGQRHAQGIPEPGGVLDGRKTFGTADVDLDRPVGPQQDGEVGSSVGSRRKGGCVRRRDYGGFNRGDSFGRPTRRGGVGAPNRGPSPRRRLQAGGDFLRRERTKKPQEVRDALQPARPAVRSQTLQFTLGGVDDLRIEQFAQLHPTQKLIEQGGIQRQGRGPALRQRGVAFVEELGHVAEQQGLRER